MVLQYPVNIKPCRPFGSHRSSGMIMRAETPWRRLRHAQLWADQVQLKHVIIAYLHIDIYIYTYMNIFIYIYIYIHTYIARKSYPLDTPDPPPWPVHWTNGISYTGDACGQPVPSCHGDVCATLGSGLIKCS